MNMKYEHKRNACLLHIQIGCAVLHVREEQFIPIQRFVCSHDTFAARYEYFKGRSTLSRALFTEDARPYYEGLEIGEVAEEKLFLVEAFF